VVSSPAEDVARQLLTAWNARDIDAFLALLTEDVEWYDPAMPDPPVRGQAAVRGFATAVLHAFPDFEYEIVGPVCSAADGSRCAIVWRITATHSRSLEPLGYAPTHRKACIDGVDVIDLRDGRISRILTAFDPLPAAEQLLGRRLRPLPGSWSARAAVTVQRGLAWVARRSR
jgi:steroid delta-isomerase-like uncharacterized protein